MLTGINQSDRETRRDLEDLNLVLSKVVPNTLDYTLWL